MNVTPTGVYLEMNEIDLIGEAVFLCLLELEQKHPNIDRVCEGLELILGNLSSAKAERRASLSATRTTDRYLLPPNVFGPQ